MYEEKKVRLIIALALNNAVADATLLGMNQSHWERVEGILKNKPGPIITDLEVIEGMPKEIIALGKGCFVVIAEGQYFWPEPGIASADSFEEALLGAEMCNGDVIYVLGSSIAHDALHAPETDQVFVTRIQGPTHGSIRLDLASAKWRQSRSPFKNLRDDAHMTSRETWNRS